MLIVLITDSVAGITVAPGKRSLTSSFSVMELEMNGLEVCCDHRRPRLALLGSISGAVINICGPSGSLTCQE